MFCVITVPYKVKIVKLGYNDYSSIYSEPKIVQFLVPCEIFDTMNIHGYNEHFLPVPGEFFIAQLDFKFKKKLWHM